MTNYAKLGINDDRWSVIRNNQEIGYVHLAFKVIILALEDYFYGEPEQIASASLFFFGSEDKSNYGRLMTVLGEEAQTTICGVLERYTEEGVIPPKAYFRNLDRLYRSMTIQ